MSKVLVVSPTRSGTLFLHKVLTAAGVRCTHERVFDYGVPVGKADYPWGDTQVEVSWLAAPFLKHLDLSRVTVWHQLRAPLKCLTCYTSHPDFWDIPANAWAASHVPGWVHTDPPLSKAVRYLYHWNSMIGKALPHVRYRVEDLNVGMLMSLLALYKVTVDFTALARAMEDPTPVNPCPYHGRSVTREDVLGVEYGAELLEMYRDYRYDL